MDSAIPVAKPRPGTPQAQRRAMPGAKLPTGHGGPGEAAEDSLASTLRKTGSIVLPLERWVQSNGSSTPLGRIVSEVKAREERWLGVQERLTAEVQGATEKLRQKALSVETLEATLQADPGYRDWAKEIRRLRQQVRVSDSRLEEREKELRAVKERSAVERSEREAAIRDAQSGDLADKLRVQAERAAHTETHLNDQVFHLRKQMQRLERKNADLERALQRVGLDDAATGSPIRARPRTPKRKPALSLQPADAEESALGGEEQAASQVPASAASPGGATHYRRMATDAQQRLREMQAQAKTLQTELDYSRRELERSQRRNESLKLRVGVLTSQVDQNARGNAAVQQLQEELEHKGGLVVQAEAAIKMLGQERQDLTAEIQELEALLVERTREIQSLYDGREAYRAQMQHQVDTLARENQALRLATSSVNDEARRRIAEADAAAAQARADAQSHAAEAVEAAALIAEGKTAKAVEAAKLEAAQQIKALEEEQRAYRLKVEERERELAGIHAQMAQGELQRTESFQQSLQDQEAALVRRRAADLEEHEAIQQRLQKDLEQAREEALAIQQSSQEQADAALALAQEDAAKREAEATAKSEEQVDAALALAREDAAEQEAAAAAKHRELAAELERTRSMKLDADAKAAAAAEELERQAAVNASLLSASSQQPTTGSDVASDAVVVSAAAAEQPAHETDSDGDDFEPQDETAAATQRSVSQASMSSASAPPPSPGPSRDGAVDDTETPSTVSAEMPAEMPPVPPTTSTVEFLALESAASAEAEAAAAAAATQDGSGGSMPAVADTTTKEPSNTSAEPEPPLEPTTQSEPVPSQDEDDGVNATATASEMPMGWETAVSRSTGATYYVNPYTHDTTYELPTEPALPSGWDYQVSRSTGDTYYVNTHTAETQFDFPTEPVVDDDDAENLTSQGEVDEKEQLGAVQQQQDLPQDLELELHAPEFQLTPADGTDNAVQPAVADVAVADPEPAEGESDTKKAKEEEKKKKKKKKQKQAKKPRKPFFSCGTPQADSTRRKKLTQPEPEPEPEPEPKLAAATTEQPLAVAPLPAAVPAFSSTAEQPAAVADAMTNQPPALALPLGWEAVVSRSTGQTYYHNLATDATSYDLPTEPAMTEEEWELFQLEIGHDDVDFPEVYDDGLGGEYDEDEEDDGMRITSRVSGKLLPAGWKAKDSSSTGEEYYVNVHTMDTTYDLPTEPAAAH